MLPPNGGGGRGGRGDRIRVVVQCDLMGITVVATKQKWEIMLAVSVVESKQTEAVPSWRSMSKQRV